MNGPPFRCPYCQSPAPPRVVKTFAVLGVLFSMLLFLTVFPLWFLFATKSENPVYFTVVAYAFCWLPAALMRDDRVYCQGCGMRLF